MEVRRGAAETGELEDRRVVACGDYAAEVASVDDQFGKAKRPLYLKR